MAAEIRLLIADDHPLIRQGIRQTLETAAEFRILAEAGDGQAALEMLSLLRPEIALLDIGMPVIDGFGVVREIHKRSLAVKVIFLTAQPDEALFDEAVALGVTGYLLKGCAASDLVSCLRAVAAGQNYISPSLTTYLMQARQQPKPGASRAPGAGALSGAEKRVLHLVAELKTNREIAETLHVSPLTVETHRRNMCEKLGLRGSNALVKFALTHKFSLE